MVLPQGLLCVERRVGDDLSDLFQTYVQLPVKQDLNQQIHLFLPIDSVSR
ncbi:hypothetical protein SDC9_163373 [bioreactor metagenome]|uniref:Uncharacterized protein n=1 Tax=bioreactor metagenome TaxID=1076179 RepID=A0A645FNN8_9ZZZZ